MVWGCVNRGMFNSLSNLHLPHRLVSSMRPRLLLRWRMTDWIVWWSLLLVTADEETKGKEYRWKKRWDSGSRSLVSPNISSTTKGKRKVPFQQVEDICRYTIYRLTVWLILKPGAWSECEVVVADHSLWTAICRHDDYCVSLHNLLWEQETQDQNCFTKETCKQPRSKLRMT